MKRNDITKLHHEPTDKLESKLNSLRNDLVITRLKIASNQEKNTRKAKMIRQDIARILTIITSKRLEQDQKTPPKTKSPKAKVLKSSKDSVLSQSKDKALSLSKESKTRSKKPAQTKQVKKG